MGMQEDFEFPMVGQFLRSEGDFINGISVYKENVMEY